MVLYHGSTVIVSEPQVNANEGNADFGAGFYLTSSLEQATRWAKTKIKRKNVDIGYVSVYDLDIDGLKNDCVIKEFKEANLEWLRFVTSNRKSSTNNNIEGIDLCVGPVADDNVYQTIRFFETGILDEEEAVKRLKVEKLHDQWAIHTKRSLDHLKFLESIKVEVDHE